MKHIRQWFVAIAAIMVMLFASCQMGGVNSGAGDIEIASPNTTIEQSDVVRYGNITVNLPDLGRGWTPAVYKVTATRSGEDPVEQTTTNSGITLRLRVGTWSFVAQAYDDKNVLIFQSAAKSSEVKENNSQAISLLLDQQAAAVKYSFSASELLTSQYPLTKITVQAQSAQAGFDSSIHEISSLAEEVLIKGLLATSNYNITVKGYIGDKEYATAGVTLQAINNTGKVKNGGALTLNQTRVTPITADAADGANFSENNAKLMLSNGTTGATIYYTLNGSTPTTSSTKYTGSGITLFSGATSETTKTVKAIAVVSGMTSSDVFSATYKYTPGQAAAPSFSKSAGAYTTDISIAITNNESSGTIRYSFDNSAWEDYSKPISITGNNKNDVVKTIYAKVTGVTSKTDSNAVSQTYTVSYPKLAKPTITPEAGRYDTTQLFTLASSLSSAKIYYSKDGSAPTSLYSAPIQFNAAGTYTVKAYATAAGYKDSDMAEYKDYEISAAEQSGGVQFTNAIALYLNNNTWSEENANFAVGTTAYYGTDFASNKTYIITYPVGLSALVSIYKADQKTLVGCTQAAGTVTFTTPSALGTDGKLYFIFNVTEAMDNVQFSIAESGVVIAPTGVSISPKQNLTITVGGDPIVFSVSYTPATANTGKEVIWSISNSSVLTLSGSTVTAKAAGTATVTATLKDNNSIKDSVTVTVVGGATTTTTTTTVAPVNSISLGEKHPSSGPLSPVNQNSWGSTAYTLGANVSGGNTTFALFSKNATKVLLEIYDQPYGADAAYDYWMTKNTSSNQWQATINGDLTNKYYAFRVWGPNWTYSDSWKRGNSSAGFSKDYDTSGNRFNPNKVVFDPYAKEISHDKSNPTALGAENGGIYGTGAENYTTAAGASVVRRNFDTGRYAPKAVVVTDSTNYGSKPQIAAQDAIIYEAHARGLTKHPSVANLSTILSGMDGFSGMQDIPAAYRGTYKGAAMMVPYLKALGINTIELLPVHESDNDGNLDGSAGGNYWAYMTYGYFAPDRRYSSDKNPGGPTKEFKEMVKAFHDEGMEVYLDVVYNHSGEGGPWYGTTDNYNTAEITFMRGIDCSEYYCLTPGNVGDHWQTTGCGNNLRCDNPPVRKLVIDSLTYWIDQMGVDGFRFDLAPVLGRQSNGSGWAFSSSATTLTQIASLGASKKAEMIAEAWDCHGQDGYQVGNFPSGWGEWNGRFRDSIRGFVGNGVRGALNDYINGDYDHFNDQGGPQRSVNFVVAHDGYTLADLCSGYSVAGPSYNGKDGPLTWPFGPSDGGDGSAPGSAFGSTAADKRQANRNYTAIQMISRGVPMIVWGDELCRTQNGNNNPYNVDSVATWNNYNMINTSSPHAVATGDTTGGTMAYHNNFGTFDNTQNVNGNFKFMQYMLNLRKNEPALRQGNYNVSYSFKKENGTTDLEDGDRCVWIRIGGSSVSGGHDYLVFMNMYTAQVNFTIPAAASGKQWIRVVDTQNFFETDMNCWSESSAAVLNTSYGVAPWSVVIMKQVSSAPATPTCDTPTISGTTPFETNTSVTISCATSSAKIYYTIDGSTPTTSSTQYSSPFTLTAAATVKAIAVKSGYNNSDVASKRFSLQGDITAESASGVMLQGFTWSSAPRGAYGVYSEQNPSPNWGKWYNIVINRADDIKNTFEYVWCPPPSKTDTASSEGYAPTQLNDLNNCYGTAAQLTNMINAIKPAKAIADIVINHRAGTNSWGDFTNPSWCDDYYAICSDDEGFSNSSSPMYGSSKKGARDTGDGYSAYRDLDHTNTAVQNGIIDWMNDVLKAAGFVGWRYDYVKGYGAQYVGKYNKETDAVFSVGEYWPSAGYSASNPSAWGNEIKNWISGTETNGGQRSKAFDFALKGALNDVFGYYYTNNNVQTYNSGSFNFARLADSANLYISQPADAVTFVDNHDTGSNQGHWGLKNEYIGAAYSLILTHPGFPCVAWSHYFTFAESGSISVTYPYSGIKSDGTFLGGMAVSGSSKSYTLRQHIDYLINLRKELGIEYNSERTTIESTSAHYVAQINGTRGSLIVEIGSGWSKPSSYSDYEIVYYGDNFCIYTSDSSKCSAPAISFNNGKCTLTCSTAGAVIKYSSSQNGTYTTYSAPFTVTEGQTVWAYATAAGLDDSAKVSKKYSSTITLHFTNNYRWSTVYAYFFNTSTVGAAWPGTAISQSYTNDMSQGVHTVTVPAGANYVIFNDGSGTQTVDITLPSTDIGYYISGGEGNACTVGTWTP